MDFFDTLRNPHVKALFREVALDRYGGDGSSFEQLRQTMTHAQRFAVFWRVHKYLKAVGLKPEDEPELQLTEV